VGTVRVIWPAVQGDVDLSDFLSIETLRLFLPALYRNIRAHREEVCGGSLLDQRMQQEQRRAYYEALLLADVPK